MAANRVLATSGGYAVAMGCDEIFADYAHLGIPDQANPAFQLNPQCAFANTTVNGQTVVPISSATPEGAGATLQLTFGMATWLAFFIHAAVVEVYLNLTPAENERLRHVSYERQLEAGYEHPGSAGLTVDRWGDTPVWRPSKEMDGLVVEKKIDGRAVEEEEADLVAKA